MAGSHKGQPAKLYDFSNVFGTEPEQDSIPLASQSKEQLPLKQRLKSSVGQTSGVGVGHIVVTS